MGPNAVHLEVDVHATNGRKHGLKEDEWIPYLTISYTIEKVGTKFKKAGALRAMTAKDGSHYANNVALMGDGDYRLTHSSCRQGKRGARLVAAVLREVDFPLPEQRSRLTATATRVSCTGTLRSVNVPSPS